MLQLFTIGRTTVAAGLIWRSPVGANGGVPTRSDLADHAESQNTQYGVRVETPDGRVLLGLVPESVPKSARRAVSGAAWLAQATDTRTLYLERIESRFWVVVAGRGQIDPRTDRVIDEQQAAALLDELLTELLSESEATRVVLAPGTSIDSLMVSRMSVQHLTFSALVSHVDARSAMRPVQLRGTRPVVWGLVAALGVAVLAGVGLMYHLRQVAEQRAFEEQQAILRAQAVEAAQLATRRDANMSQAVLRSLAEDTETPSPDAFLAGCMHVLERVGLEAVGWKVVDVECQITQSSATITFVLPAVSGGGVSTHAALRAWALDRFSNLPAFSHDNYRAQLSLPLTLPPKRERLQLGELAGQALLYPLIHTRLQLLTTSVEDANYALTPLAPKSILFEDPAKASAVTEGTGADRFAPVPPERAYRIGQITINGRELDGVLGVHFDDWRFFTLNKVAFRPTDFAIDWTLEAAYVAATQG